jgi:hypothetical protein
MPLALSARFGKFPYPGGSGGATYLESRFTFSLTGPLSRRLRMTEQMQLNERPFF